MISPYDVSARSAAAVSACWLGERVVTLLPGPVGDLPREPGALARAGSPAFSRLTESWEWSSALWRAGVLTPGMDGETVSETVRSTARSIGGDASSGKLGPLMQRAQSASDAAWFDSVCRDLILGGFNPAVSVPLSSAVERFAAGHGLTLMRVPATSLAGKLEAAGGRVVFRVSLMTVLEADASDLLKLRASMGESLARLRAALVDLLNAAKGGSEQRALAAAVGEFERVRTEYERVLSARAEELRRAPGFSGQRLKLGQVTLSGGVTAAGTVLSAADRAARIVNEGGERGMASGGAVQDGALSGPVLTFLTVKAVALRAGL